MFASELLVGNLSGRGWALFCRPGQDRMIPHCIAQQLAIDAGQRRGPVANRGDLSSKLRNIREYPLAHL